MERHICYVVLFNLTCEQYCKGIQWFTWELRAHWAKLGITTLVSISRLLICSHTLENETQWIMLILQSNTEMFSEPVGLLLIKQCLHNGVCVQRMHPLQHWSVRVNNTIVTGNLHFQVHWFVKGNWKCISLLLFWKFFFYCCHVYQYSEKCISHDIVPLNCFPFVMSYHQHQGDSATYWL